MRGRRGGGDPYNGILAAIVNQATADAKSSRECGQHCGQGDAHYCRADAVDFLRSDWCEQIMEYLGLAYLHERVETVIAAG